MLGDKRRVQAVPYNIGGMICLAARCMVTPDNNAAENAIRPVALGRKNWLFAGAPKGADASAMLFSLVETAKDNEIEPQAYLKFLFERFPAVQTTARGAYFGLAVNSE